MGSTPTMGTNISRGGKGRRKLECAGSIESAKVRVKGLMRLAELPTHDIWLTAMLGSNPNREIFYMLQ